MPSGIVAPDAPGRGLACGTRACSPCVDFSSRAAKVDAVDHVERIDRVALRLRHLLALGVAHDGVDVDVAERHLAGEVQGRHDHARDPEEDDVEAGDQHRGRQVERALALELRLVGPAERGERARSADENQVSSTSGSRDSRRDLLARGGGARERFLVAAAHEGRAVLGVPRGDLVAPPELARDAPVLDVLQPLAGRSWSTRRARSACGRRRRPSSPACAMSSMRTNHWSESIGSTTASERCERGCMSLWGFTRPRAPALEVRQHALPRLEAVEPAVGRGRVVVHLRVVSVKMPISGSPWRMPTW